MCVACKKNLVIFLSPWSERKKTGKAQGEFLPVLGRSTLGTSRNKRTERGSAQNTEGLENLGNWRETKIFRSIAFFYLHHSFLYCECGCVLKIATEQREDEIVDTGKVEKTRLPLGASSAQPESSPAPLLP